MSSWTQPICLKCYEKRYPGTRAAFQQAAREQDRQAGLALAEAP